MTLWLNGQPKPSEPSHGQIYERMKDITEDLHNVKKEAEKTNDTLHSINLTMARMEATMEERGKQLLTTEQTIIVHNKEINELKTQVHILSERGKQTGSILKDYIFPVLLCVISSAFVSIVGLLIFQAKMESTTPGPAMEQRRQ